MPWVRLDDQFYEHPRVRDLSHHAFRLHVSGLCLCSRLLTDGLVSAYELRLLQAATGAKTRQVRELVDAGLWEPCDGGHRVRDYHDYNPSAQEVKAKRRANAERQRDYRGKQSTATNTTRNASRNALRNGAPSHPIPIKPLRADAPVEKPHSCPVCGIRFRTLQRRDEHLENVHYDTPVEAA